MYWAEEEFCAFALCSSSFLLFLSLSLCISLCLSLPHSLHMIDS